MIAQILRALPIVLMICSIANSLFEVNLTGNWKLNIEKSKFGVLPAPTSRTVNITHQAPRLKLEIFDEMGTQKRTQIFEYTTDGKRCTNNVRGREFQSTVRWEGTTLVIETEGIYQDAVFRSIDRWKLSQDQKTITIERDASNDMGETRQTLILEKQ